MTRTERLTVCASCPQRFLFEPMPGVRIARCKLCGCALAVLSLFAGRCRAGKW